MLETKKKKLTAKWLEEAGAFKPDKGFPVGASTFDSWLRVYLKGRAAALCQEPTTAEALRKKLQKIREEEVAAHNALRKKDYHWQRDIGFMQDYVDSIVEECKENGMFFLGDDT